jgi:hypothetical protein
MIALLWLLRIFMLAFREAEHEDRFGPRTLRPAELLLMLCR